LNTLQRIDQMGGSWCGNMDRTEFNHGRVQRRTSVLAVIETSDSL